MNKMKYIILVAIACLCLATTSVQAADTTVIGVGNKKIKQFAVDGTHIDTTILPGVLNTNYYPAEFSDTDDGNEWVRYHAGDIEIFNPSANLLAATTINLNYSNEMAIAVGELDETHEGPEIAVCKYVAAIPRVRVYSYDDSSNMLTKINSFDVFKPTSSGGGCEDLAIADADKDGGNDLFIVNRNDNILKVYTTAGELLNTIHFGSTRYYNRHRRSYDRLYAADVTGDGITDAIYGEQLIQLDGSISTIVQPTEITQGIKELAVIDVTDDGLVEYVYLTNTRKARVYIVDTVGNIISDFNTFPNATSFTSHKLYFGF